MNLVEIAKSLRRHHQTSDINVGWVSWCNDDQKTTFSEGVTIIKNPSLQYVAYIVCVKDDKEDELSTDEEDAEIPMTPMFSAKSLIINHTSIPESPEGSDDDTDDSEIIMSSQQKYTTKKVQPIVLKTPKTTNTDSVFWNSSTRSPSFDLHFEDSTPDESEIPQIEDNIHDALTQVTPNVDDVSEIDSILEQRSKVIPRRKSFHEQETQIIPIETIHSIHNQETQMIPEGLKTINKQENQKPNSEKDDEEETETIGTLEIEMMNKKITKKNGEMQENAQENRVVDEQNPKLLIHEQETQVFTKTPINAPNHTGNIKNPDISANESDCLMADSDICNFDMDEESEAPDSPDSMSLLEIENFPREEQTEIPHECDPYEQDTQIMDPVIPTPVQSSGADDELTQVLDDRLIVPPGIVRTKTQSMAGLVPFVHKGNISLADACMDSQPDKIIFDKKTSIGDSGKVDLTQEKIETLFDMATQKVMVTQEANVLDLPTQKMNILDKATHEVNVLDMPTQEINILDMPTQEVNILKLPTKKIYILEMPPTQEDNITDMLTPKIEHPKKAMNVKMLGNTKGTSLKDNFRPVQILSSNDFKIGSSLSNLRLNKSYVTPIKRQVLADSNSFSFSTPANVDKKKKGKLIPSDASFDASAITHTINELNSSCSSLKSISTDEENYYNNTRELEDDLLSQTVVSVTDKSPATSKTLTTSPLISAAGGKNYYGCTQDIMEDLLTQKLDCNNISPVKPSPVEVSSLKKRDTVALEKGNENKNYYAFTQDIVNELLTQEEPPPDLQEPSFEKCSTDLLFSKLPKPFSCSQSSDNGSDIIEITPLKRFRHTISDSDLDSPQIKNFAIRGQLLQSSSSDIEKEEDSMPHTEEDAPIVYRRAVPKKKPKNQPVEVKQKPLPNIEANPIRVSSRVRKDVIRLLEEDNVDKNDSLSLKNKSKVFRRTSVYIERLPDELVGVSKITNNPSNSVTEKGDKGTKKKAKLEIDNITINSEGLQSTSNVKPSVIEKGSKGRQNSSGKQELKPSSGVDKRSGEVKSKTNTESSCRKVSQLSTDTPGTSATGKQKKVSNRKAKKDPASNVPEKIKNLFDGDDSPLSIESSSKGSRDKTVNESKKINSAKAPEALITEKRGRGNRRKIIISNSINISNSGIPEQMEESGKGKPAKRQDSVPKKISTNEGASKELVEANERTSRKEVEKSPKNNGRKRPADSEEDVPDTELKRARSHSRQKKTNIRNIMLTQIADLKALEAIILLLGGKVVDHGGDVLVMGGSKRTVKLMVAIAQGIPVVSQSWLTASKQMKSFQDPWKFILSDKELENKFKFNLKTAINTAHPYLTGWVIYLTPKILPSPQEIKTLIEASGGKTVLVSGTVGRRSGNTAERGSQGTSSISCKEDRHIWPSLPSPINTTEAIMLGAIHHKFVKGYRIDEENK